MVFEKSVFDIQIVTVVTLLLVPLLLPKLFGKRGIFTLSPFPVGIIFPKIMFWLKFSLF